MAERCGKSVASLLAIGREQPEQFWLLFFPALGYYQTLTAAGAHAHAAATSKDQI